MQSILAALRRLLGLAEPSPPASQSIDSESVPPSSPSAPPPPETLEVSQAVAAPAPTPGSGTLAMPQLVATTGVYPIRDGGGSEAAFTIAMVQGYAGGGSAFGAPRAEGQMLRIAMPPNQELFSILGTSFGGDGITTFALPNLDGRVAIGGEPVGEEGQQSLTLTWMIATNSSSAAPLPGMVALFAASWAPDGWLPADGSLLPIYQDVALFEAIGATYGGNGATDFALPDLNGAAAVGVGQGPGLPAVALGQKVSGTIAGLGLNYLIAVTGIFPPSEGPEGIPANEPFLGQVIAYAGASAPPNWALCDGSLVQISDNQTLYSVIGTIYGGDGETTFALPDLRGRMIAGLHG